MYTFLHSSSAIFSNNSTPQNISACGSYAVTSPSGTAHRTPYSSGTRVKRRAYHHAQRFLAARVRVSTLALTHGGFHLAYKSSPLLLRYFAHVHVHIRVCFIPSTPRSYLAALIQAFHPSLQHLVKCRTPRYISTIAGLRAGYHASCQMPSIAVRTRNTRAY